MLPPPSFLAGYVLRGLILWVGIRFGAASALMLAGEVHDPVGLIFLRATVVPFVVGAVFLAARIDDRARRDELFLADIGVRPGTAAGVTAAVALVGEVALQVAGVVA